MTEVTKDQAHAAIEAVQETLRSIGVNEAAMNRVCKYVEQIEGKQCVVTDDKLMDAVCFISGIKVSTKEYEEYSDYIDAIKKYSNSVGTIKDAISELTHLRAASKLKATRYDVGNGLTIERTSNKPDTWAIRKDGRCMSKDGSFEYEPLPSNRDADFLGRCRFNSLSEALDATTTTART